MKKILATFTIIFLGIILVKSQISFQLNIQKKDFGIEEYIPIQFVLQINNQKVKDISRLKLPSFTNAIVKGSNIIQNQNISEEDNDIEHIQEVVLKAIKPGKLKIGAASVIIDGKSYTTKPLTINITTDKNRINEDLAPRLHETFLELQLSNKSPYPNEGVPAKLKLYTRSFDVLNGISDQNQISIPNLKDLYINHIKIKKSKEFNSELIDGEVYLSKDLGNYILFPTKPGEVTIGSFSINLALTDGFFEERNIVIKSTPIALKVKNYPSNMPKSFTGVVGNYSLKVIPNKKEVKTQEALTIQVVISGEGNSSLIKVPNLIISPEGIEKYTNLNKLIEEKTPTGITYSISATNILVPYKGGKFTIETEPFSFFDLKTKSYKNLTIEPIQIKVLGDSTITVNNTDHIESAKYIADSIRKTHTLDSSSIKINTTTPNNTQSQLIKNNENKYHRLIILISIGCLIATILALLYFTYYKRKKKKGDLTGEEKRKKKTSNKERILAQALSNNFDVNTELFKLKKIAEKGEHKIEFYRLLELILQEAVKQNLNITEEPNLTSLEIEDKLSNKFGDEYAEEYKNLLLKSHIERYSNLSDGESLNSIYNKTEKLVKDLL